MTQKFAILAHQRSGSNMLVSLLDAHPDVTCYGEVFRKFKKKVKGPLSAIEGLPDSFLPYKIRAKKVRGFLKHAYAPVHGANHIGFKIMMNQAPKARRILIKDTDVRKVFLYRENALATYSSGLIAKATGQGLVRSGEEVKRAKVHFDAEKFHAHLERRQRTIENHRRQLNKFAQDDHIEIEYLEAVTQEGQGKIFEFLDINPIHVTEEAPTLKRNTSVIIDRFINADDVRKYLTTIGKSDWEIEGG